MYIEKSKIMKILQYLSSFMVMLLMAACAGDETLLITDFGGAAGGPDCTPAVIKALESARNGKNTTLVFPKGTYHFYPDFGKERYMFVSNNDPGLKRIIFPLLQMDNLTIDGQGSEFIFHGMVNPFAIEHSKNIFLKNFSIDFQRPFHSEAIISSVGEGYLDVEIPAEFPYRIQNGLLQFTDQGSPSGILAYSRPVQVYEYRRLLEFDTEKRETAFMARDYSVAGTPMIAESLGGRNVRLFDSRIRATPGNTLVFHPSGRHYPGFIVSDSEDVVFERVIIHNTGGMGIIAQRTRNVTVSHCQVTPSGGRMVSATADATHFVNCTGEIILAHNLFENQKDDATNIHGIYLQIVDQPASNEIVVKLVHNQQFGFDFIRKGVELEFVRGKSLIPYAKARAKEAERINMEYTRVVFHEDLPGNIEIGDAVAEIRDYPKVHIHDNIIRNNRARGMLLNCRGETIVENNYFHAPGAAILFEGDAHFWFEQGGVSNCIIRNNTFDNCMFGVWGKAVIDVKAGIHEDFEHSRYNKNITITGNTFRIFDDASLLNVYCVDGLLWKDNIIEINDEYPPFRVGNERFVVNHSDNIIIDGVAVQSDSGR